MIIQFTLIKEMNNLVLVTLVLHKGIDTIKGIHMYNNIVSILITFVSHLTTFV